MVHLGAGPGPILQNNGSGVFSIAGTFGDHALKPGPVVLGDVNGDDVTILLNDLGL